MSVVLRQRWFLSQSLDLPPFCFLSSPSYPRPAVCHSTIAVVFVCPCGWPVILPEWEVYVGHLLDPPDPCRVSLVPSKHGKPNEWIDLLLMAQQLVLRIPNFATLHGPSPGLLEVLVIYGMV